MWRATLRASEACRSKAQRRNCNLVELIFSRDREGIDQRAVGQEHLVKFFLELEQAAFAGKELAPVERDDCAELGVGLFAGGPGVDLGDGQLDRFAAIGFFGILGSLKALRALEALSVQPSEKRTAHP